MFPQCRIDRSGENASFTESWTRMNRANWGEVERERGDDTCVETRSRRISPTESDISGRRLPFVVVTTRVERLRFSHGLPASPWKFLRFHILVLHKNPRADSSASQPAARVIVRASPSYRAVSLHGRGSSFFWARTRIYFELRNPLVNFRIGPIDEEIWKFDSSLDGNVVTSCISFLLVLNFKFLHISSCEGCYL